MRDARDQYAPPIFQRRNLTKSLNVFVSDWASSATFSGAGDATRTGGDMLMVGGVGRSGAMRWIRILENNGRLRLV